MGRVLLCPRCGSRMKILAYLTDPPVVEAVLDALERPSQAPEFLPRISERRRRNAHGGRQTERDLLMAPAGIHQGLRATYDPSKEDQHVNVDCPPKTGQLRRLDWWAERGSPHGTKEI